jgi:adenosylcobyric acid synthase
LRITEKEGARVEELEGACSHDGRIAGTSVHGLFDSARFRRSFIDAVRAAKGLEPLRESRAEDFKAVCERAYDLIADTVAEHLDLPKVLALAGIR